MSSSDDRRGRQDSAGKTGGWRDYHSHGSGWSKSPLEERVLERILETNSRYNLVGYGNVKRKKTTD